MSKPFKMSEDDLEYIIKKSGKTRQQLTGEVEPPVKPMKKSSGKNKKRIKKIESDLQKQDLALSKNMEKLVANQKKLDAKIKSVKAKKKKPFSLNFRPKDYLKKNITSKTATMKAPKSKKYSQNGIRQEWVAHGVVSESSGTPELITNSRGWKNSKMVAFPKSNPMAINPRSKGSLSTNGREFPSIAEVKEHVGGDPLVPKVRRVIGVRMSR